MTKKTKNLVEGMLGCFEWLSESETLFVYIVIPVLCVVGPLPSRHSLLPVHCWHSSRQRFSGLRTPIH